MNRLRVLHIQHFVYPWRFPLFAELGSKYELDVFFCRAKRGFRRWDTTVPEGQGYHGKILRAINLGPLTFNPGLWMLLRKKYDIYSVAALDRINFLQFMVTLCVAKIRKKPFVMVDEFLVTDYYRSRRKLAYALNIFVRKWLYPHVDAFVLWNDLAKQFVTRIGVPSNKVFYGPQILSGDEGGFRRQPGEITGPEILFSAGTEINILYVGNLVDSKGVKYLIEAVQSFPDTNFRLWIVGDGNIKSRLENIASGDMRVVFYGHLQGAEKRKLFKNAHIFVLPTLHEPWGFVVNEALEWGLPVITTSAAGCAKFLVKDNGIIVPPGDVNALREALIKITSDHSMLSAMGQASQRIAASMTVADMAKPFCEAVKFVMSTHTDMRNTMGSVSPRDAGC